MITIILFALFVGGIKGQYYPILPTDCSDEELQSELACTTMCKCVWCNQNNTDSHCIDYDDRKECQTYTECRKDFKTFGMIVIILVIIGMATSALLFLYAIFKLCYGFICKRYDLCCVGMRDCCFLNFDWYRRAMQRKNQPRQDEISMVNV